MLQRLKYATYLAGWESEGSPARLEGSRRVQMLRYSDQYISDRKDILSPFVVRGPYVIRAAHPFCDFPLCEVKNCLSGAGRSVGD